MIELDFAKDPRAVTLGSCQAIDYFSDGSFYIINAPGRSHGHLNALARTTLNTFIFMAADTAHHGGEFRPSSLSPLPRLISPNPLESPCSKPCPGDIFVEIHRERKNDEAFYLPPNKHSTQVHNINVNDEQTLESITCLQEFDAMDNVLTILAHDRTISEVVDFFPAHANDWKVKGWKEDLKWKFLRDFKKAV